MRSWLDIAVSAILAGAVALTAVLAVHDRGAFLDDAQARSELAARYIAARAQAAAAVTQRSADRLGEVGIRQYLSGMRNMELQDHVDVVARALEFYAGYELLDRAGVSVFRAGHVADPITPESGQVLLSWPLMAEAMKLSLPVALPLRCALRDAADMAVCARAGSTGSGLSILVERSMPKILAE